MATESTALSRFGNTAPALVRAGFAVLPVVPHEKRPALPRWSEPLSVEQVDALAASSQADSGTGLLSKRFPGLDIDIRDHACAEVIQAAAEKHFGPAPVRIGAAPKRLLMYRTDDPFRKVKVFLQAPDGTQHAIEFLGDGQQYVINGRHPSGVDYTWPNGDGPGDTEVWDLSPITLVQVLAFIQQLPKHLPPGWSVVEREAGIAQSTPVASGKRNSFETYKQPLDGWTVERVERELLVHLDPDAHHDIWIRVLMGVHHQFDGSAEALDAVVRWSMGGSKFQNGEIENRWESFNRQRHRGHGAITLASVIKLANEASKNSSQGTINTQTGEPIPQSDSGASEVNLEALRQHIVDMTCCSASDFTEHEFAVNLIVPVGEVTLLGGHGGSGKSSLAITAAIHVALGLPFGPHTTKRTRVLIVSAEDHGDVVRDRIAKACAALNVDPVDLDGWLFVLDLSEVDATLAATGPHRGDLFETPTLRALGKLVEELGIGLTILDNLADVFAGDEINRREVRGFIRAVRQRLARPSRAVILLAHLSKTAVQNRNKDTEDYSGSTAWHNSVRSRLSLTANGQRLQLTHQKSNYGPLASLLYLRWVGSVPVPAGAALGSNVEAESLKEDCRAVLTFITGAAARKDPVTTAETGSASIRTRAKNDPTVPEELAKDGRRFTAALQALQANGEIVRATITKNYKPRDVYLPGPPMSDRAGPNSANGTFQ